MGGLLGIGGGVVAMPVLRFGVGLPPAEAAGTCVAAVLCTTLGGSYRHFRLGHIDLQRILPIALSGVAATALFSWAFVWLARRPHWLDLGMGLIFSLVAIRLLRDGVREITKRRSEEVAALQPAAPLRGRLPTKIAIGTAAGVLPGLFGIGTGAVLVPAFTLVFGASIKTAVGCSLACFSCNALVSTAFKAAQGHVVLPVAVPLGIGALLGSNLGAFVNQRTAPSFVRMLFGLVFCYVAGRLVIASLAVMT